MSSVMFLTDYSVASRSFLNTPPVRLRKQLAGSTGNGHTIRQFIYRQSLTRFILKMTYVVIYLFCVVSTALLSCQPRVSLTK
ncbi:hypothetical protein OUZ56_013236 [Daphnia magna]|uniref:Uncharacterized protein n=1 Tax=Daphnia magna TaxID=35525 RepID=A0ABQ9Z6I7_9CRUS|nr:hypothetical protein OUZ56_013236 [Daphnia magna]